MTQRRIVSDVQLTREEMLDAVEGNTLMLEDWDDIADAAALKVLDRLAVDSGDHHAVILALRAALRG